MPTATRTTTPREPFSLRGRHVALLTKHEKERVVSPILEGALDCQVTRINSFDTDLLGTFTREIPRAGSQREAARRKALRGDCGLCNP